MTTQVLPKQMSGVLLTGHGGFEKLEYRTNLPIPEPAGHEVLIKVGACAVNNSDINTRIGWYSKKVKKDTESGGSGGFKDVNDEDASWSGIPIKFPRIQGAGVAGKIVAVGKDVNPARIGDRVLVRSLQELSRNKEDFNCIVFGSECDGGFAQFTKTASSEAFKVNSTLSDVELASFPSSYSTAENMLVRSSVDKNETVLITGASGGVGSGAVQLAKLRNAKVIAVCSKEKADRLHFLGADEVIPRGESIRKTLDNMSVDVVLDLVGGGNWHELFDVLKRGGRYAVAGAIAGPMVELDLRTLYLKDLTFFGCTYQPRRVFENLVHYIERGDLRPLVARHYPLENIKEAQKDFLAKKFVGKLILVPPHNY